MLQFPIFTQHFPFPVCKSEALHLRFNLLPLTTFSFPTLTNQAIAQWKSNSFYIAFINTALFLSFGNKVMAGKHRELYRGLCAYPAANSLTFGSLELFEMAYQNSIHTNPVSFIRQILCRRCDEKISTRLQVPRGCPCPSLVFVRLGELRTFLTVPKHRAS